MTLMKLSRSIIALAAAFSGLFAHAADETGPSSIPFEVLRDHQVVEDFRVLPAQENGRIKPLDTVARFKLLRYSGKQTIALTDTGSTAAGIGQPAPEPIKDPATGKPIVNEKGKPVRLSAIEWLLVSWFRPDIAKDIRVFTVDNSDAVVMLDLKGKGKRDHYSYNEVEPAREKLMQRVQELQKMKSADLSPEQRALAKLASDFLDFTLVINHFEFARAPFGDEAGSLPGPLAEEWKKSGGKLSAFLPGLAAHIKEHPEAGAPMSNPWFRVLYFRTRLGAAMSTGDEAELRIFPPADRKIEAWHGPGTVIDGALQGAAISDDDAANLTHYGELALAKSGDEFKARVRAFTESMVEAAQNRNEYRHVTLEVTYHKSEFFYYALLMFVFATLSLALSWVAPRAGWGRWCVRSAWLFVLAGAALGLTGIVIRCIIMERPPITTLYETIIFITTSAVVFALVAEVIMRRGLALTVACLAGAAGMFISLRFMDMEAKDTMEQLQAVLITTFWLSTHVPCINLGYAAGMVAAIMSMIYFSQRLFGFCKPHDARARELSRMAYGFVMASLFLSLVGTVLGGVWANYSWGRFWGWDPKENGALMIVLMNLVILHARLGGYVREVGFHALNIVLGMITVFSWFATNQLGIGLHSYGQLSGVWKWLYIFWSSQLVILAYATVLSFLDRRRHKNAHDSGEGRSLQTQPSGV